MSDMTPTDRIDVSDLPDGTVVETSDGKLARTIKGGWQTTGGVRQYVPLASSYPVRVYDPRPLPSEAVPREKWASIPEGTRVQVETDYGVTITGRLRVLPFSVQLGGDGPRPGDEFWHSMHIGRITALYILDPAPDPDAALIERVAQELADVDVPTVTSYADLARAALRVIRESQ